MDYGVRDAVRRRKSVRSFDGSGLTAGDRAALEEYIKAVKNPFGVPVEFRLLEAKAKGLASPVVAGAEYYLAAKARRGEDFELGFGYSFESACLYAASLGVGTVILAASLNRSAFEKAMELRENEVMPVATPVGYPANKRTIREQLMRAGLKADDRLPFEKLFFDGQYGAGLSPERAGDFAEALEMVRWAPSATNKQPWRAVVLDGRVHFYEEKTMRDSPLGDVQKVDMGIALAHFDLTMQENGVPGGFAKTDPGLRVPENVYYIMSWEKRA